MVGALIFLQKLRISPDAAFSANDWTAFVIFIVVIGGIGTLEGPILGTLVFFALRETLSDLGTAYLIALGAVAILVMLKAPRGLWGLIRARAGRAHAQALATRFDVRAASLDVRTRSLSGGNMQKLILGRTLAREPRFIVADQPTWGLDIGAVAYVREQLLAARRRGAGVLLISEDLEEIFALADRIAVLCGGRLVAVKPVAEWTPATVGLAMTGTAA